MIQQLSEETAIELANALSTENQLDDYQIIDDWINDSAQRIEYALRVDLMKYEINIIKATIFTRWYWIRKMKQQSFKLEKFYQINNSSFSILK